jgi:methyl-accepting chemotaxis protein
LTGLMMIGSVLHATVEINWRNAAMLIFMTTLSVLGLVLLRRARRSIAAISGVLEGAAKGDLERRVILLDDAGEIARLARDTNRILDVTDAFVREARATLGCVRDGRNHRRIIETGMVGTYGLTSGTMNQAVSAIEGRLSGFGRVMREFEETVGGVTGSLGEAVLGLSKSADQMRSSADDTEHRTTTIGAAAEETSVTVATVAAATEELTAAVEDIAQQAERARAVSEHANRQAHESRDAISDLTTAVGDIVGVVDLIRQVAEQTKLLALNATIEAARAGEAGRGFGVVAIEVKALADQTATATEAIAERIRAVEARADRCMQSISGITGVIDEIGSASTAISAAVQEQIAATHEISRSMQMASTATDDVSANVTTVVAAAGATGRAAADVAGASDDLAHQIERLQASVRRFLTSAREVAQGSRSAA